MKTKDVLMVATGLLAILLGAMPLNGYFGYMRDPGSFHRDAFVGSAWHLLVGIVPVAAGILLLASSKASARPLFLIPLCSIPGGLFLALPSIITGHDHHAWLTWLSIVTAGCVLAVLIHITRSTWHHPTLHTSRNGGAGK